MNAKPVLALVTNETLPAAGAAVRAVREIYAEKFPVEEEGRG